MYIFVCEYFCKKKKKKKSFCFALCVRMYLVCSTADMGMCSNSPTFVQTQCPILDTHSCTYAFERTLYGRAHSPYHIDTLSTNAMERTLYIRSHAFLVLHMTLLGHPTLLPLSFPPTAIQLSSLLPHFS
jgi:hypothetical protein